MAQSPANSRKARFNWPLGPLSLFSPPINHLFTFSGRFWRPSQWGMTIISALFLIAAASDSGAVARARATVTILPAERIDFDQAETPANLRFSENWRLVTRYERSAEFSDRSRAYRLVEFE